MKPLLRISLGCLLASGVFAQRHGGGGGGGHVGGGGHISGGIGRSGYSGGGRGSVGIAGRGYYGGNRGYGYRAFGYRGFYGRGFYSPWFYGWGLGGWGWPWWDDSDYDYGYDSGYPYAQAYDTGPAYDAGPNVNVVAPPPAAPSYPIVITQSFAHPVMHEYRQPEDYGQPAPYGPPAPQENHPILYLIAFRNHVIHAAMTYWVEGGNLHYIDLDHKEKQTPLSAVDRDFSAELNYERHVPFRLPS
jgi:hypothetical protein